MMLKRHHLAGTRLPIARGPILLSLILVAVATLGVCQSGLMVSARAQSHDPTVTSDSPEYCGVLLNRITGLSHTAAMPPPTEAAMLSREGARMCVHGQTRGGIMRLRRALLIMLHGDEAGVSNP
jgi:hypothetical protein